MKACTRCLLIKPIDNFCKNRRKPDDLNNWCRCCAQDYKKKYYEKNKIKINEKKNKAHKTDKQILAESAAKKIYYQKNKYKILLRMKEYRRKNKEFLNSIDREKARRYRRDIPQYRMAINLRRSLRKRMTADSAKGCFKFLPYTPSEFYESMIGKLQPGMKESDLSTDKVHIDHIIPLSWFHKEYGDEMLNTSSDCFIRAWGLNNLQPLWAIDNLVKSDKYHPEIKKQNTDSTYSGMEKK